MICIRFQSPRARSTRLEDTTALVLFVQVLLVQVLLAILAGPLLAAAAPSPVSFRYENEAGRDAARQCAQVWAAKGPDLVATLLGTAPVDTVVCLVVGSASFHERFGAHLPDWGVGVALGPRAIALDTSRIPAVGRGLQEVFLHEMVHALIMQGSGGAWLPAWFHEGAAMQYSGEWRFTDTVSLLLDGRVPDLSRLQDRWPATAERADRAYRTSLLAVGRLDRRHGPDAVPRILRETRLAGSFHEGFLRATGETPAAFTAEFAETMRQRFGWLTVMTRWPGLFVLLGVVLAVGAVRKIVLMRRRLARMPDEDFPPDAET